MIVTFSWLVLVKVLTYLILLKGNDSVQGLENIKSIQKVQV